MGSFLRFTGSVLIGVCLAPNPVALLVGILGMFMVAISHNFDKED